jgi:hypothetical protein
MCYIQASNTTSQLSDWILSISLQRLPLLAPCSIFNAYTCFFEAVIRLYSGHRSRTHPRFTRPNKSGSTTNDVCCVDLQKIFTQFLTHPINEHASLMRFTFFCVQGDSHIEQGEGMMMIDSYVVK